MVATPTEVLANIDLARLLEARLWVARLGETDVYNWWRTDGILGDAGAFVGPRVLPRTHPTARARIAFAVAAHSCQERHPDRHAMHLFRLTPDIEDRFDQQLVDRLADTDFWTPIMKSLEGVSKEADVADTLKTAGIVTPEDLSYVARLTFGAAERSLPISASKSEVLLRRLAAGFSRSTTGNLAVPFLVGAP